jgi:hypothetical protein
MPEKLPLSAAVCLGNAKPLVTAPTLTTVRPELVEGRYFLDGRCEEGVPFDKLRANG